MKRRAIHVPLIFTIVLGLLVAGLLQSVTPRLASAQDGVEQPDQAPQPAATPPEQAGRGGEFVPEQLLVRFRADLPPGLAANAMADEGAVPLKYLPELDVYVLRVPPGLTVEKAVEVFSHRLDVEYAEPNYILHALQVGDPGLLNQWAPQKIEAPDAWSVTTGSPDVVIAIVDTGVDYRHPQLAPNIWANSDEIGGNGVDDDQNGFVDDVKGWNFVANNADPLDDNSHGTHVSGIAAAVLDSDSAAMAGICPGCKLMPVKVLNSSGSGSLDVVASGITYAANNGALVINMSLGASAGAATLESAVNYAWGRGVLVAAAAGNDGGDVRSYPAAYPNAISVASTDITDSHSCFSNSGYGYVTVAAPGERIFSTTPLNAAGEPTYATFSGTSMATPHVAGLAGLLFSKSLNWTNGDVRALIQDSVNDLGPTGLDAGFGAGRVNARRAMAGEITPAALPPSVPSSDFTTASAYAHARKLARDGNGNLHIVWHSRSMGEYQVLHAQSGDNGARWSVPDVVFASSAETYQPAIAVDGSYVYVALPSKEGSGTYFQVFFTRRGLAGGSWSEPAPLFGGTYHAVRPDLFVDPSNGRLHLVASSLDDAPDVYYRASRDRGANWTAMVRVNPSTSTTASNTRYATVYAYGDHVYIAAKTMSSLWILTYYYLHTVRSIDGGNSWFDQFKVSSYQALSSGEYGLSLAGVGDRLYMGYEVGGGLYFRTWQNGVWSNYLQLETAGRWPSITQAADGQAWLMWENAGSLLMRHNNGSNWEPATTLLTSTSFDKGFYPNLRLRPDTGQVEWVSTSCRGAPFSVVYGSLPTGPVNNLPTISEFGNQAIDEDSSTAALAFTVGDVETPGSLTLSGSSSNTVLVPAANIVFDGSGANRTVTVSPAANQSGTATITVTVTDANAGTASDTFVLTVNSVNDAPVAVDDSYSTTEDTALTLTQLQLKGNDTDVDNTNAELSGTAVSNPTNGMVVLNGNGTVIFTPAAGFYGTAGFDYTVSDGGLTDIGHVTINVTAVNNAPVANPQSVTTRQGTAVAITLTGSDVDDNELAFLIVTGPAHGGLSGTGASQTYTPAAGYSGPDSFTFKVNDGLLDSAPAAVSITINPAVADPKLYLGSSTSGMAGTVAFADEDILTKDMVTGAWTMYIDGSDIGLAGTDVDGFDLMTNGDVLMSFDTAFTLTGFGAVDDSDILRFVPTSTGDVTAGAWQWYFDGSDAGLTTNDEDVDAFTVLPDGRLLISTLGNVSVTGASGVDEDLLAFTSTALGATTSGTWAMHFDGSDVGLSTTNNEDVNGVWVDAAGNIYLTTLGAFSVTGASGDGSDIFVCTPGTLGNTTTCTWAIYWDGSTNGFSGEDTDSLSIVP